MSESENIHPSIAELENRVGEIVQFRYGNGEVREGRLTRIYSKPIAMIESLVNGVQLPVKPSDIISESLEYRIARLIQNRYDEIARAGGGEWQVYSLPIPGSLDEWERQGRVDSLVTQILEVIAQAEVSP